MITTAELKNLKVSGSGDKIEGRVYTISVAMILRSGGKDVFDCNFSEMHEDTSTIKETMTLIQIRMKEAKTDFEDEQTMRSDAEKELQTMTDSINELVIPKV